MEALAAAGFDLVHAFDAARVGRELALPQLVDAARPFGLLVGNTRTLWPRFLAVLQADRDLAAGDDPLDRYTERALGPDALYAHRRYDGAFLPFQRIAVAAGLGTLSPTHLVIHPQLGPWFALRGIALVAEARVAPPCATACRCDAACTAAYARAVASGAWRDWLAVRDACSVGRQHRYDDDQIAYHYTKDRRHLR